MIIPDEDDQDKTKDPPAPFPTVRYPDRAASRRSLPDYETSQAFAFRALDDDSHSTLLKPPPRRRLLDSRVWRAAIISLLVYIFLTLVIGVPIIVHKELEDEQKYYSPPSYFNWPDKKSGSLDTSGNNITGPVQGIFPVCNNWTTVEYLDGSDVPVVLAMTERLVSPNGLFSISSNASYSDDLNTIQGAFYAGVNPNQTVQDAVLSITMQASSPALFDQSPVCFALADNFTDLLLYVPDSLALFDIILYNITLLFPQSSVPSRVDSFATFLPMFDQQFNSFENSVIFDKVFIQGDISRVTVDFIQANRIVVDTSLEPVAGTFHANTSLLISTIMAPVTANISLYNDPNSPFPTSLDVHTGNSNLTANVTILAPNKNYPPRPNFIANLRTFSGSLSTDFLHDPASPPTSVQLHVINDLGPVNAVLDSLFQGIFQVSTKQATAYVSQGDAAAANPWLPGQGRTMQMDANYTMRSFGWIGWSNGGTPAITFGEGEVTVDTSLADATLTFLG